MERAHVGFVREFRPAVTLPSLRDTLFIDMAIVGYSVSTTDWHDSVSKLRVSAK